MKMKGEMKMNVWENDGCEVGLYRETYVTKAFVA